MGLFGFMKKNSTDNISQSPPLANNNPENNFPPTPEEQRVANSPLPFDSETPEPTPFPNEGNPFTQEVKAETPTQPSQQSFDVPDFSEEEILAAQKPVEEQEISPVQQVREEPIVQATMQPSNPFDQKPTQTQAVQDNLSTEQPTNPTTRVAENAPQQPEPPKEEPQAAEQGIGANGNTGNLGPDLGETNNETKNPTPIPTEWVDEPIAPKKIDPEESQTEEPEANDDKTESITPATEDVKPIEERVVVRNSGVTEIFVEKEAYKSALLEVASIVKDGGAATDHITRILDNEAIVSAKLEEWHGVLDDIQEKLMLVDTKLFDKGDK